MPQQTMERAAKNVALLEAGYAAFAKGDLVAMRNYSIRRPSGMPKDWAFWAAITGAGRRCFASLASQWR